MFLKLTKEKIEYIFKFVLFYNIYSNLLIGITAIIIVLNIWIMGLGIGNYIQLLIHLISIALSLYLLFKAILISSTYKKKWKFYSITKLKIKRDGFKHTYFKSSMYEPCMRIITWDILRQNNLSSEYTKIKELYCKLDFNLETEKDKLIKELNILGADSIKFN